FYFSYFFFNDPAPSEIYTLSLHDALPISCGDGEGPEPARARFRLADRWFDLPGGARGCSCSASEESAGNCDREPERVSTAERDRDRKSTRLNSSHVAISYAVFCLKKKNIE